MSAPMSPGGGSGIGCMPVLAVLAFLAPVVLGSATAVWLDLPFLGRWAAGVAAMAVAGLVAWVALVLARVPVPERGQR